MSNPPKSFAMLIAGYALKLLLTLLIIAVCVMVCWRAFLSDRAPKEMRRLLANEPLADAYGTYGRDLTVFTQSQDNITRGDDNYGYFSTPRVVFIPQAKQIQVLFRYNNSTLESVAKDLSLDTVPEAGVEIFDVTLLVMTDLTPEDSSDNVDGSESIATERIAPTDRMIDTTSLYTFILYTFDGVDPDGDVLTVYLDVYYGEDADYSADPLGTLRLYHCDFPREAVKLSRRERKALEAYS